MLTRVVIIRHAKAASGASYPNSEGIPLTEEGKFIHRKFSEYIKHLGLIPSRIICSPLLRAQQTAEIMSAVFERHYEVEDALGDYFDADQLLSLIPGPDENQTIFFIGHAPSLTSLINRLVGQEVIQSMRKSTGAIIDFRVSPSFGSGEFGGYIELS